MLDRARNAGKGDRSIGRSIARAALTLGALVGCGGDADDHLFRAIENPGVDFVHVVELTGTFPLPEIMGAGCAIFDADGDGGLDLYFTNAGRCGGAGAANRLYLRGQNGLYRDATETSGLGDTGFGMGVAIGDIDNDGDLDVYVGNDGPDALYRNDGGGKFTDVTGPAGITGNAWTSSVAFVDYDCDGWLDIFVVHYVTYDPERVCTNQSSRRDYCSPKVFKGVADKLYRNRGDGTFVDVSTSTGIAAEASNGLGVVVDDFDDDGWPDVYVANDGQANHLWMNDKHGAFVEKGLAMGAALNGSGVAEASMGVAAGDVDGDGDADLFMTHLRNETNTLYLRDGPGFVDASARSGLGPPSLSYTGFGTAMIDIDHDGALDVVIANGRVEQGEADPAARIDPLWNRYAERNQVFLGDGRGSFAEVRVRAGAFAAEVEVSRGLAVADLDGDGDLDLVLANCRGPARIYENTAPKAGHWLQVRVVDPALRRDVYGAVVLVHTDGRVFRRTIGAASSYLSSSAMTAHFGLGAANRIERIEVRWPGGGKESFSGMDVDTVVTVQRGSGK